MKFNVLIIYLTWSACTACGDPEEAPDDGLVFNVPRTETASGASILDDPTADRGGFVGLCEKQQVYCNGECLADVGDQAGSCTLLQNNIGLARSIAVDASALYYTAANSEILRMDLASLTHTSLAAGLASPSALVPAGGMLYFGNNTDGDAGSDLRVVSATSAPEMTVLTEHLDTPFDISSNGDEIFVAAGGFSSGPLYSLPADGGRWTKHIESDILHFEVSGESLYFTMNTETEDGIFTSTLADPGSYTKVADGNPTGDPISRFFVQGSNIYWFASKAANTSKVFTSVPVTGGTKQDIQIAGDGILLAHNSKTVFYLDSDVSVEYANIMMLSLSGGEAVSLATVEPNEIQAVAADESSVYVALGYIRTGGVLRLDL